MKGFQQICKVSDLPERKGKRFTIGENTDIAVFKIKGKVYAVSNICPHNHSQVMYEGYVDEDLYLSCPVHGWKFSLENGNTHPVCKGLSSMLKTFEVIIEDEMVWVKNEKERKWFMW